LVPTVAEFVSGVVTPPAVISVDVVDVVIPGKPVRLMVVPDTPLGRVNVSVYSTPVVLSCVFVAVNDKPPLTTVPIE
jgi:hypothetical protein